MRLEFDELELLAALDSPLPPSELRGRTLAAAREALGREPTPDVWSRLWFSRPLRVAWGLSIVACVVGHVAVTLASRSGSRAGSMTIVRASLAGEEELREIIDLPRVDQSVLGDIPFMTDRIDNRHQRGHES